ncbi:MAG: LysR family transcriptional regulator [Rhodovibrionaceae bacterium]
MTPGELSAMLVFARVVDCGGFTAAAEELDLSKSAVSKQIARLEDRLGTRLLNRTTRTLSLTEAGTAFYERCLDVVAAAQAAEATVQHLAEAPRGELRINAPMSFGQSHIAPALPDFLARYPELTVDLVLNDRLVDLVEEGFDVGVRIGPLDDSSLVARRLAPARRVLCAAPAYLARAGTPARPEDLRSHDCIAYSYQLSGRQWRFRHPELGERRVKVSGRLKGNNGDALVAAAAGGLGVVLSPTFIVTEELRSGALRVLLPDWQVYPRIDVNAVFPASRNLSLKVRVFVDFLAARFGETPSWDEGLPAFS